MKKTRAQKSHATVPLECKIKCSIARVGEFLSFESIIDCG